jgi:hypothetical protein
MDGAQVFSLLTPVAPPTAVRLGAAPHPFTTTAVFAGRVRAVPVPTPICHQLERGRAGETAKASSTSPVVARRSPSNGT